MADKNVEKSVQLEYGSYLSIKDSTCLCTGLTLNVYPFIIQFHIAKPLYGILTVAAGNDIRPGAGAASAGRSGGRIRHSPRGASPDGSRKSIRSSAVRAWVSPPFLRYIVNENRIAVKLKISIDFRGAAW